MRRFSWLALSALSVMFVGACSGDTTDKTTTDAAGDDDDDDDTTHPHSDATSYIDIDYAGFELETAVLADGSVSNWMISGYDIPPTVYVYFADLDYFYAASTAEQDAHSCVAFGSWLATPLADPTSLDAEMSGGTELYAAWEQPLAMEYTSCFDKLDPAVWGQDGYDLLSAWHGAHFAAGLGPMTQTWMDDSGIPADVQTDFTTYGQLVYIAINDMNGDFVAKPWSWTYTYAWDSVTKEPVLDGNYLTPVDVSDGTLHESLILTNAFWYEGFYDLDLSNLHDGAR